MAPVVMLLALFSLCCVTTVISFPVVGEYFVVRPASQSDSVTVYVAVKYNNVPLLKKTFMEVSDPFHANYGLHIPLGELATVLYGVPDSVKFLEGEFNRFEATSIDKTMDSSFMVVTLPASKASELFGTGFYVFEHALSGEQLIRTLSSDLPARFVEHVDFILGHVLPTPTATRTSCPKPSSSKKGTLGTTPSSIDQAYSINGYVATSKNSSQAVASFLKQYFSPTDLTGFQKHFNLPLQPIDKIVGENDASDPGLEATLDVQYLTSIGKNVTTWFVSTSGTANKGQENFLVWIMGQLNTTDSPWVHSVSYGDLESSISTEYKERLDLEFQKFGASGRTILVAAGDSGVGCHADTFVPDWPTSCPYITSVGGSTLSGSAETVWPDGGGGFSNIYPTPSWQQEAVKAYLTSGVAPASHYFNSSGRAYPDVAAFATNFEIFTEGSIMEVDGTSCAAPTFAAVVSLLNDVRLNNGKSTFGFLNPLLYSIVSANPTSFQDITQGSNPSGLCPGFKASKGWDPASGWGSPDFSVLKNLV